MFYVYDGSFESFLSAVTVVMRTVPDVPIYKRQFYGIIRKDAMRPLLEYQDISVIPDIIFNFGNYVLDNFGEPMTKTIYHAFLSEVDGIENSITEYIFLARKQRRDPIDQLYNDSVRKVASAAKTVTREAHSYLGLLRFRKTSAPETPQDTKSFELNEQTTKFNLNSNEISVVEYMDPDHRKLSSKDNTNPDSLETLNMIRDNDITNPYTLDTLNMIEDNAKPDSLEAFKIIKDNAKPEALETLSMISEIFIADCEPVTCSLPLIAEHFVERLPNQNFIIFDRKRKICIIHTVGYEWSLQPYDALFEDSWQFETSFEQLWQIYFKTLAIPERINPKLQQGNMPKRYWKYLIERPGNCK